jgi:hypothetical protein
VPDIPKYAHLEIERRWLADLGAVGALEGRAYREIHDSYIAGTRLRVRKISGPAAESAFTGPALASRCAAPPSGDGGVQ